MDELSSPSPGTSLLSEGTTSGDLIYHDLSSDQEGNDASSNLQNNFSNEVVDMESDSVVQVLSSSGEPVYHANALNLDESSEIPKESVSRDKGKAFLIENETLEIGNCVVVDRGNGCKRLSEPNFLKMILSDGMGNDFSDTKLVFLAVHAVFLEFGFVGFDPLSGLRVDNFDILKEQTSLAFTTTVSYTDPKLLSNDNDTESIVLNLQTLGHYVNVFGSLAKGQVRLHKLNINKSRFVPALGQFWVIGDYCDRPNLTIANAEEVILEFWKFVKDELALPLMIDLCETTGLVLPACFTCLPKDLKFQILELLSGQDIARMSCVCHEMRNLCSNNELWEKKYISEFGRLTEEAAGRVRNWNYKFVNSWRKALIVRRGRYFQRAPHPFGNPEHVPRFGPNPFGIPPMIVGDRRRGAARPYAMFSEARNWRVR